MIVEHYTRVREDQRLEQLFGKLERARTGEIVARYLPKAPASILDVGGGTGIYARWLAGLGHEVHLIDLTPKHVETARELGGIASAETGDARSLARADASADAVLLLGPLYHLQDRDDRLRALREARRVLRSGGVVFAAGISRWASLLAGLYENLLDDADFAPMVDRDLADGCHLNPTARDEFFTTAYFHPPGELADELREAGFERVELLAIEGPGWLARDFEERWADEAKRARLLDLVRRVEREPELIGLSFHILAVGRTP